MDPLSMTASIIALLQVTGTITGYINALRHASKEQQSIAMEASYLYGVLTSLRFRVQTVQSKHDPWFHQLKALSRIGGPLDQMQEALSMVKASLQPRTGHKDQLKAAISWQWSKTEVRELLQKMQHLKSLAEFALASDHFTLSQATYSGVQELTEGVSRLELKTQRLEVYADQELQDRISRWLCLPDPSLNYQAARDLRHGKTGFWILSHTEFTDWKDSASSMIWLHGKAGCGKTVLSSTLIQAVKNENNSIPVAYFYFDFRDVSKQSPEKAMRSILFQIALQYDSLAGLERLYTRHGKGSQQPSNDDILHLLRDMVTADQPVYIVLDALDECTNRVLLLNMLQNLYKLPGIHFAVTSRRERDLEGDLVLMARYSIDIESSLADEDIATYIREQVNTDVKLTKWSLDIRAEIISTLSNKANGMFRWAYCQLEAVRKCLKLANLRKTLATLPKTLDETYNRIMQSIETDEQLQDAILVMKWMCFSRRPLTLLEAVDVLTLQVEDSDPFCAANRLADPDDLLMICPGLLQCIKYGPEDTLANSEWDLWAVLREQENYKVARLAHFSVKEYFISDRCSFRKQFEADDCHVMIAKSCLLYLLHVCELGPMTRRRLRQFPLAKYAADNWWRHISDLGHCPGDILRLADRLLDNPNGFLSWARVSPLDTLWPEWQCESSRSEHALSFAVETGIHELVQNVLQRTPRSDEIYGNALVRASENNYHKIVELLLDSDADINFVRQRSSHGTALSRAADCGHEKLVKYLIEAGANVQACSTYYFGSTEGIDHLLMDAGVDLTLTFAKGELHLSTMQRLLGMGIDIETRDFTGRTALQMASSMGAVEKVQFLIDAGADVNACSDKPFPYCHEKPITIGVSCNHPEVVEILVKAGAHLHDGHHQTVLHRAAKTGNVRTIKALLNGGADVNAVWGQYDTSLQIAAVYGHGAVLKELIRASAAVNNRGGVFGTALQAACCYDECQLSLFMEATPTFEVAPGCIRFNRVSITWETLESKIRLLLSFTEQTDETELGSSVLLEQTQHCNKAKIKLVHPDIAQSKYLPNDAGYNLGEDLNMMLGKLSASRDWSGNYRKEFTRSLEPDEGSYCSFEISITKEESITQTLLDLGASVRIMPNRGHNSKDFPYGDTCYELVKELFNAGAEVDATGGLYGSALQAAARFGHLEACRLMLAHGADVNFIGGLYGTTLQAVSASFLEWVPIVQHLLNAGADVNIPAGEYGCALSAACYRGHINIVRILLDAGADVNLQGGTYGNPLQAACASSQATEELIRMLMDAGADRLAEGGKFGSALGACLSKRFRAAMVVSRKYYAEVLEGEKQGDELDTVG